MKKILLGMLSIKFCALSAMHEQALLCSREVQKSTTLEEVYKTDPKEFLKDFCLDYEKHFIEKERWYPKLGFLNCLGCDWDQKAYTQAKFFRPFVAWHLNSERRAELQKVIPKEYYAKLRHACDLFIEAGMSGRNRDNNWCCLFACFCCCVTAPDWGKDTLSLVQPFKDLKILVEYLEKNKK